MSHLSSWLQVRYKLPPHLGRLLALLMQERTITVEDIEQPFAPHNALATDAFVAIHRLRKIMTPIHGIPIYSQRGVGYWLEDEDKEKIRGAIAHFQAAH